MKMNAGNFSVFEGLYQQIHDSFAHAGIIVSNALFL